MYTLQRLAIPIAIVIAGALIAGALFLMQGGQNQSGGAPIGQELQEISGIQSDDHILGNPQADVVIVEYSDPECPFCQQFHTTMHRIINEYGESGRVAWVYRHFPLSQLHPKAPKEAEALECAYEQGGDEAFWAYTDRLYEITPANNGLDIGVYNTPGTASGTNAGQLTEIASYVNLDTEAFESCLSSGRYAARVQRDLNEVVAAGGLGTPHSFVLIDGEQVPVEGAQPYEVMKGLVDTLLSE